MFNFTQKRGLLALAAAGFALAAALPAHAGKTLDAVKARAIRHPLVGGHLLSADASASLILLRLATEKEAPAAAAVIKRIETVLSQARAAEPDLTLELTGLPVLREQAAHALRRDMLIFNSLGL